jgi:hypothetical protein
VNLITNANVKVVSTADIEFLQDDTEKTLAIVTDRIKVVHVDGAYYSPSN